MLLKHDLKDELQGLINAFNQKHVYERQLNVYLRSFAMGLDEKHLLKLLNLSENNKFYDEIIDKLQYDKNSEISRVSSRETILHI